MRRLQTLVCAVALLFTATSFSAPPLEGSVQMVAELPKPADAFVDGIGVSTHFGYAPTKYYSEFPKVRARLREAGIRHVRDLVSLYPDVYSKYLALASDGVTFDFAVLQDPATVAPFLKLMPARTISTFESGNEPNVSGKPDWTQTARAHTTQLHAALAGRFPLVGPAMAITGGWTNPYAALGDLSSVVDYGNVHDYTGNDFPGTPMGPSALRTILGWVKSESGNKPVIATETGFCDTQPPRGWVTIPREIAARYEPRMFLEHFRVGVDRVYQYEFIDEATDDYSHCGLVDADLNPKPSYILLKNLIHLLADPGREFVPKPLAYAMSVGGDVHHMLYQRRSGTYYLFLWIEARGWNPTTRTPLVVEPQTARIRFATHRRATVTVFNDDGSMQTRDFHGTVAVTDRLTVLTIR